MPRRRLGEWRFILLSLVLTGIAIGIPVAVAVVGCTSERQEGNATIYSNSLSLPSLFVLIALAIIALGAYFINVKKYYLGWGAISGGLVFGIVFVPGLLLAHVTIDDERYTMRAGPWFMSDYADLEFAEVKSIQVLEGERWERPLRGTPYKIRYKYLMCQLKSGKTKEIYANGDTSTEALRKIVDRCRRRGVQVVGDV